MTMLIASPVDEETDKSGWTTLNGAESTVRFQSASFPLEQAQEMLRETELLLAGFRRLLEPESAGSEVIEIYLAGAPEDIDPESHIVRTENSATPLAYDLCAFVLQRWFGPHAAESTLIVDGIAGIAAGQAGIAPAVEEAEQWVSVRFQAGEVMRVVTRNGHRLEPPEGFGGFDPVATAFISFLVSIYGRSALRKYLAAYDPRRRDQAAIEAYRQPLAVLEEEWHARLRRRHQDPNVLRSFLRHVLPLLRPYRWKQVEILIYLLLAAGYNVVQPYAVKTVIDRLTHLVKSGSGGPFATEAFVYNLAPFLLLLFGIYVLNGAVSLRQAYSVAWLNQNVLNELQLRMYSHLQRLSHNFYINARLGDLMARLNSDLDNVQSALSQVTNKALYRGFTVIGSLTALLMLTRKSPVLGIPIMLIVPLFIVNYVALRSRNKLASREQRQRVGQTMASIQEDLAAHSVVKAFGLQDRFILAYRARLKSLQRSKLRLAVLSAMTDLSEDLTTGLAQLIVFGVGGYLVLSGQGGIGIGDMAALLLLVKSIFGPIASLAGIGQTMQQATGSMERVEELFREPVRVKDRPDAIELPPLSNGIRFENVSFHYGGDRQVIENLTVSIRKGEQVAIVGPSGAGKSSLVNLLMRFWDPEEGRILFDDHDLRDVKLASMRSRIGLVFQETFIFNTTLRANIAIGRPDATDEEIEEAARAARMHDFIQSLPAGYDTVPGEAGARLSAGQKQRIAIARIFLRNPEILILDEATSALDPETESTILETLSDLAKGRTTISVTHRINQAANADRILVIEDGRLVEEGAHAELLAQSGLYRKLYEEATGFVGSEQPLKAA